ncbi:MAG: hypothetical protein CMJ73_05365 [Planctomycetaceae bacterium]|nr:hypothetical protein [Planctomycetaceae bacterium]
MALFFWVFFCALPGLIVMPLPAGKGANMTAIGGFIALMGSVLGAAFYLYRMKHRVVDSLVVNMVDVGEETGELDTMLYKVADQYDEEVKTLTDGLMALLEPLLIVFLGLAVGFIVVALFLPLVDLIQNLSK